MFNFLHSKIAKITLASAVAAFLFLFAPEFNEYLNQNYLLANHVVLFSVMIYALLTLFFSLKKNYIYIKLLKERGERKKIRHAIEHRVIHLSIACFVAVDLMREAGILSYEYTHGAIFMGQANAFLTTFKAIAYIWAVYFSVNHLAKEESLDLNC